MARCISKLDHIPDQRIALFPSSLSSKWGEREPGNTRRKSCQLPVPCSGGTNQIAEQNHVYVTFFSLSQKLSTFKMNELISADYTSKVDFQMCGCTVQRVQDRSWFAGLPHSPYITAPSLQSALWNSTELRISRGRRAKL